jgi:RNA polymerase sigma factor (sigma-70 family)
MVETLDDFRDLMRRVQGGSEEAARELVEKYGDTIRRAVRRTLNRRLRSRFDSLDLVQIVWGSFFRRPAYDPRFDRPEQLAAFLLGMVKNKVLQEDRRFRTQKRGGGRECSLDDLPRQERRPLIDEKPLPGEMLALLDQFEHVLETHSERDRQIILLRSQGMLWATIAEVLEINEGHAQRTAANMLREIIEE